MGQAPLDGGRWIFVGKRARRFGDAATFASSAPNVNTVEGFLGMKQVRSPRSPAGGTECAYPGRGQSPRAPRIGAASCGSTS